MKNIKNIICIALLSLFIVSCEDNTESIINPGEPSSSNLPVEVKVGFLDDNTSLSLNEGETATFTIGMGNAVPGEVTVNLNVTSSDGGVEATYPTSVTLVDGQRAETIDIVLEDDGISESEIYTVEIVSVDVDLNQDSPLFVHNGEIKRVIGVRDLPTPLVTTAGDLTFNFSWSGTNDLDCRLLDAPPTTIFDAGETTTPGETVLLLDAVPDGDYLFTVRPWIVNDSSISYTIDAVAPTETRSYGGTFSDLVGDWAMEFIVLNINKSTRGTVVTYFITQE